MDSLQKPILMSGFGFTDIQSHQCKQMRTGRKTGKNYIFPCRNWTFLSLLIVMLVDPLWKVVAQVNDEILNLYTESDCTMQSSTGRMLQTVVSSEPTPGNASAPTTQLLANDTMSPMEPSVSLPTSPVPPSVPPSASRIPTRQPPAPVQVVTTPAPATSRLTVNPTLSPTVAPTSDPTKRPTRRPTRRPTTDSPTPSPTQQPSTLQPSTAEPSDSPPTSEAPSPAPVVVQAEPSPTVSPVASPIATEPPVFNIVMPPTEAPSPSFQFEKTTQRVRDISFIALRGSGRRLESPDDDIDANCTKIWQTSMQERIEAEVVVAVQQFETMNVELLDVSKRTNATVISFVFDVLLEIRMPSFDSLDIARLILGPFDSQAERNTFASFLKSTNCSAFEDIVTFSIIVPSSAEEQSPQDKGTSPAALYAGLAVAGAAILMMGITVLSYSRFRNNRRVDHHEIHPIVVSPHMGGYVPSVTGGKSKNSDISTLGDPIPFGAATDRIDGDLSTNGSFSIEYDYKNAFLDTHSEIDSQVGVSLDEQTMEAILHGTMVHSLTDDIATAGGETGSSSQGPMESEEKFDVVVPPGMLGLILESNPDDGRPTIYNIKPNSILSSILKVGDIVEMVDGEYVAAMKACEVSRVIALKQDHVRVLVFCRPIKRRTYPL